MYLTVVVNIFVSLSKNNMGWSASLNLKNKQDNESSKEKHTIEKHKLKLHCIGFKHYVGLNVSAEL